MVLIGPSGGARDANMATPAPLPPAFPDLDVTVARAESLRPDMPMALAGGGHVTGYREEIESTEVTVLSLKDGAPVAVQRGNITYMAGWGDDAALDRLVAMIAA